MGRPGPVAEQWCPGRAWHATLAELRGLVPRVVEEVLEEGVASRESAPGIDVGLTAGTLVGMVVVGPLEWRTFPAGRSIDDVRAAFSPLLRGRITGGGGP
ncbi:hypothetical protein [Streptomyces radicis]|uniref:Uncharacterized protein n=1 Tax=Streptomyces radicis TaxID=1750517 RepID=A0A3A9VZG8_9ACTN|nr:hypothetical protein [Streptomyces radicis]RKN06119.1 hypothetical protein D7319_23185 [Streptomyces radicis]RKN18489.1 hypothetical protein D7318_22045 [Streptomyces radicis]